MTKTAVATNGDHKCQEVTILRRATNTWEPVRVCVICWAIRGVF